jgi:F-type H+-transporting ATPase subunit alpha
MKINADEITAVLKKEISQYASELKVEEEGTILEVGDGICRVYGLQNALAGEMLEFSNGASASSTSRSRIRRRDPRRVTP